MFVKPENTRDAAQVLRGTLCVGMCVTLCVCVRVCVLASWAGLLVIQMHGNLVPTQLVIRRCNILGFFRLRFLVECGDLLKHINGRFLITHSSHTSLGSNLC